MKIQLLAGATVALLTAVNLTPAMAQGSQPSSTSQRIDANSEYAPTTAAHCITPRAVTAAGAQFGPLGFETDLLYLSFLAALVLEASGPLAIDGLPEKVQ